MDKIYYKVLRKEKGNTEKTKTKMATQGKKRQHVEEYEDVETREGQRNRKREKKASPLYYTYRPLISDDQDKSPTTATVNDTDEAKSVHNEGSYQRARKYVGEDKWGIARELIMDGRTDYARMSPDAKTFITTRVALAKNWDRVRCCRFRLTPCICKQEESRSDLNSALYCCKENGCACAAIHNCFNRWDILVKGCAYPEQT